MSLDEMRLESCRQKLTAAADLLTLLDEPDIFDFVKEALLLVREKLTDQ